jgi:hypothetical protein
VAIRLMAKVQAAPKRKDGSCTVDLSDVERDALYDYTDAMVCGARDNIDPPGLAEPNWALAELNSGTALLRKLSNLKGK